MKTFGMLIPVLCVCCLMNMMASLSDAEEKTEKTTALLKVFMEEFVEIHPGEGKFPAQFTMGREDGEKQERPARRVEMSDTFYMARYEVPQNLYRVIMGNNPSRWKGERNSVEMISWHDANSFCKKITTLLREQHLLGEEQEIRLPSETEWEYCCRAGTNSVYSFGDAAQAEGDQGKIATLLDPYAWHTGNAAGNDPPVGALKPNPWGLYDMHGYLWEFTSDDWKDDLQTTESDSQSISLRGGSWKDKYEQLTCSFRKKYSKDGKDSAVGFRCVKAPTR